MTSGGPWLLRRPGVPGSGGPARRLQAGAWCPQGLPAASPLRQERWMIGRSGREFPKRRVEMPEMTGMRSAARRQVLAAGLAAGWATLATPPPGAQPACPARPIRLIVPFPAGGTTDLLARLLPDGLGARLGQ